MSELKPVVYGYIDRQNFIGPDNKKAVIAELLKSDDAGVDLQGYLCEKCGFIYMHEYNTCHVCNPDPDLIKACPWKDCK